MAKLSQNDWIEAGLQALNDNGISGVKVERLASALKVSKGSFYWHFKNRRALLDAMLEYWEEGATKNIISLVNTTNALPEDRLRHLAQICFLPSRFDAAEANWRIASTEDPAIAKVCKRVDKRRMRYVQNLLEDFGLPTEIAKVRSHFMYLMLIGNTTWVQIGGRKITKTELEELFNMLTKSS